jgi:hypothetical protein
VASGHEEVRVNENAEHAESLVEFYEAHTAHVGSQVVYCITAINGLDAGVFEFQVKREVFGFREALIPLPLGLFIHGPDRMALGKEGFNEFAADESAGAGYKDGMGWHCC